MNEKGEEMCKRQTNINPWQDFLSRLKGTSQPIRQNVFCGPSLTLSHAFRGGS